MEERERPGSPVCDDMRLERQGCRAASAMYSVAFPALSHSYSPRPTLGMLHGPHPPTSSPSPFSPSNLRSRARAGGGCKYPASPTFAGAPGLTCPPPWRALHYRPPSSAARHLSSPMPTFSALELRRDAPHAAACPLAQLHRPISASRS
ncbi:hypothetical protein AcW1_006001 [Taiwanofungus camphoratus]|nr:hypothetical protein AcW1_006001 [Antrodia cinnamomea]